MLYMVIAHDRGSTEALYAAVTSADDSAAAARWAAAKLGLSEVEPLSGLAEPPFECFVAGNERGLRALIEKEGSCEAFSHLWVGPFFEGDLTRVTN